MAKNFQVGCPEHLRNSDPWFEQLDDAYTAARELHAKKKFEPVAIWDNRSDYVALFYDGQEFKLA